MFNMFGTPQFAIRKTAVLRSGVIVCGHTPAPTQKESRALPPTSVIPVIVRDSTNDASLSISISSPTSKPIHSQINRTNINDVSVAFASAAQRYGQRVISKMLPTFCAVVYMLRGHGL